MRDPFFYRWHAYIDDVFQKHKESAYVRPYTRSEGWELTKAAAARAMTKIKMISAINNYRR